MEHREMMAMSIIGVYISKTSNLLISLDSIDSRISSNFKGKNASLFKSSYLESRLGLEIVLDLYLFLGLFLA
jgi:hypothetical protein